MKKMYTIIAGLVFVCSMWVNPVGVSAAAMNCPYVVDCTALYEICSSNNHECLGVGGEETGGEQSCINFCNQKDGGCTGSYSYVACNIPSNWWLCTCNVTGK